MGVPGDGESKRIDEPSELMSDDCTINHAGSSAAGGNSVATGLAAGTEALKSEVHTEFDDENAAESDFLWDNDELKSFWEACFPMGYNFYSFDGLHPKALCSKICKSLSWTSLVPAVN